MRDALWRKDTAGLFEQTLNKGVLPTAHFKSGANILPEYIFTLFSKVLTDFTVGCLIPDPTKISLRFNRSAPVLCLMGINKGEHKIELKIVELFVPRYTLKNQGTI